MPGLLDSVPQLDERTEQGRPEGLAALEEGYFSDESLANIPENWRLISEARESAITLYPDKLNLWSETATVERVDVPSGETRILLRYSTNGAVLLILRGSTSSSTIAGDFRGWFKSLFSPKEAPVKTFASFDWVISSIAFAPTQENKALDLVHDNVNELFLQDGGFDVVSDLLERVPLSDMTVSLIFAWVCACFQARQVLRGYPMFLERVKHVLRDKDPTKIPLLARYA